MAQLLSLERCDVSYGPVRALTGVSLDLQPGEIVGVVGALGAGKTTLMRALAGLVQPSHGSVRLDGEDITRLPWDARARLGIVHVPAGGGLFPTLTVAENLMLAEAPQSNGERRVRLEHMFPLLVERRRQTAGSLSGGEQRQLAVARGALSRPRVLLLDEPLLGLSPVTGATVMRLLTQLGREGVAILISEERPTDDLRALAGRLVGLRAGHVVGAAEVMPAFPGQVAGGGDLERVEVEMVGLPLSTRDRRALQTIAQARGIPVGRLIAELAHRHTEENAEEWE
ncbi:MAG: ATP-binding cassette domain-containing protein [Candidatus Dormibacteraeota bacterium]|nr:ATP-binding cassette domain-containing protein [Candidatus Dormibacteraeota bacterium]